MRFVIPFLSNIAEEIVSEVNRKGICDDEAARQIARETMKMYGLSFIEKEVVKHIVEDDLSITGI